MSAQNPLCRRARYRRVETGDTFYLIARDLGTTVEEVTRLNPGIDPENLQVGSLICLPLEAGIPVGKVPPCDSGLYWVIAPGDTIFTIAGSLGIPLHTLLVLNPSLDPENLLPGDSICLPPMPGA
jgi:LysM repeat protein